MTPETKAEIARLYRDLHSLNDLARDYHTTYARIREIVTEAGVPIRPQGGGADYADSEVLMRRQTRAFAEALAAAYPERASHG